MERTSKISAQSAGIGPLRPADVLGLHELFCQWASFRPSDQKPAAIIEACLRKKKKQNTCKSSRQLTSPPDPIEEENDEEPEPRIGILNSFFIEDLERTIEDASRGNVPRALERYLCPLSPQQQIDLESERNAALLATAGRLNAVESKMQKAEADNHTLQQMFQSSQALQSLSDLNSVYRQKEGLWHTVELAHLRSSLFAAALTVHEAWLAEVARKKGTLGGAGFRANILAITTLLSNKIPEHSSEALATWQSLFMIVPVVSTTFASFATQFRNIPAASLGWVFIDEAGQAVPQAAAGALWRSRHAIVVGDPRQIEPVFTLPSRFISALAALSPETADGDYSPHRTSVQRLADRSNSYGVFSEHLGTNLWLGSPLRVHRRCIDPMFSWANEIAYGNKMVYGLSERTRPNGPPIPVESIWIEMKGRATLQQAVPEQTHRTAAKALSPRW